MSSENKIADWDDNQDQKSSGTTGRAIVVFFVFAISLFTSYVQECGTNAVHTDSHGSP